MSGPVLFERGVKIVGSRFLRVRLIDREGERRVMLSLSWGGAATHDARSITMPIAVVAKLIKALEAVQEASRSEPSK